MEDGFKYNPGYKRKKKKVMMPPIVSYGIICFTYNRETNNREYLLYRRRDTFEYIDFLRGGWYTPKTLPEMFSKMTIDERERLAKYTLEELWDDLWVDHTCKIYLDGLVRARKKYDTVKHLIPKYLAENPSSIINTPMGFPKGKKNKVGESSIECALRECREETRINVTRSMVWSEKPYVEIFSGGNGKYYKTIYYLVYLPEKVVPKKILTPQCLRKDTISEEAIELHWLTYNEACKNLNKRRAILMSKVADDINNSRPPGL